MSLEATDDGRSADLRVTPADLRAEGVCLQGARRWFGRYGLDWRGFLAAGILAQTLAATGDAVALRVVDAARRRAQADAGDAP